MQKSEKLEPIKDQAAVARKCREGGGVSQRRQLFIKACSLDVGETLHHQALQPHCGALFQSSTSILLGG